MVFGDRVADEASVEVRYVIREYAELLSLLTSIRKLNDSPARNVRIQGLRSLLHTLRGGFVSGEERVEYQVAKHFKTLTSLIERQKTSFSPRVLFLINEIMGKARVHEATLEVLGARGGELEVTISQALACDNDEECAHLIVSVEKLIKKAITADRALERCLVQLVRLVKNGLRGDVTDFPSLSVR